MEKFYQHLRGMNVYTTTRDDQGDARAFSPGRDGVKRLLMEPIANANGSTLDDSAITYGIVFPTSRRLAQYR
ncbi:MAG: dependent oxidoreductase [Verrucomicrobia bacterium]|nr:dependent oxidoreductase [Verrucomicrobiota bacterium]